MGGRQISLSFKLLAFAFVTVAVIIGVLTWLNVNSAVRRDEATERQDLIALYDGFKDEIKILERASGSLAVSVASRGDVQDLARAHDRSGLLTLLTPVFTTLKTNYGVVQFNILEPTGVVLVRVNDPQRFGDDITYRLAAATAIRSRQTVSGVEIGPNRLGVRSVSPMLRQGELIGLMEVGLDCDQAFIESLKARNRADYLMWVTQATAAPAGFKPKDNAPTAPLSELLYYAGTISGTLPIQAEVYRRVLESGKPEMVFVSAAKQELAVAVTPLLGYEDRVLGILEISTSRVSALAALRQDQTATLAIAGGIALLALAMMWGIVKWVVLRSLGQLTQAATLIANGDLSRQAPVSSRDELGTLALAFNQMVARLRETLHLTEDYLKKLPAPVLAMDREFNIQFVNERGTQLVGMTAEAVIGKKCYDLMKTGHCQTPECRVRQAMEQAQVRMGRTVAGGLGNLPIQYAAAPIKDANGNVVGGIEEVADISELTRMTDGLREVLTQAQDAAQKLDAAAAEILAATTQQASGASEQSAAISQTTTTVDEVKVIAEQASARAQEVAGAAQRTVEVSRSGQKAVRDTIESMGQIKERVEGIAENILALSEQTQQIGEIIATVNDLASQSNILALNASIEAARAGEHGKGFAVVAVEVRNLAEQSRQATTQVKTILSEIQKATNATVMATEEGTKRVDVGVGLASQARQTIEQLSGVINESAQAAAQMGAGGRQQVSGVEQIALAMRNINQATVQSLASTRQAEKSAQSLTDLAYGLTETVGKYQL